MSDKTNISIPYDVAKIPASKKHLKYLLMNLIGLNKFVKTK